MNDILGRWGGGGRSHQLIYCPFCPGLFWVLVQSVCPLHKSSIWFKAYSSWFSDQLWIMFFLQLQSVFYGGVFHFPLFLLVDLPNKATCTSINMLHESPNTEIVESFSSSNSCGGDFTLSSPHLLCGLTIFYKTWKEFTQINRPRNWKSNSVTFFHRLILSRCLFSLPSFFTPPLLFVCVYV